MDKVPSSVLMIAYHFPPQKGSSGIQRTLRFCRYLPTFGWNPIVLTVRPGAYEETADDLSRDVPAAMPVVRAFALNAARSLSICGRYPAFAAIPDRWVSWVLGGVVSGLWSIRKYRPTVIWSTYPIATAHLIAYILHRMTGLPWVADFRDPMAQDGYPPDPRVWRSFKWIEAKVFKHASACLFTSPSAIRDYLRTYPDLNAEKTVLLENGYDEDAFAGLDRFALDKQERANGRVVLLHSGIVYTEERDPTQLFSALGRLKKSGRISADVLEIRFRASANDALLARLARDNDVQDIVSILPAIAYSKALSEMASVDALLVLQAANCNSQIPAKVYEYLRVGRPILALTDERGDTAAVLSQAGVQDILPLDSIDGIEAGLPCFIDRLTRGDAQLPDHRYVQSCSREARTRQLAQLLSEIAPGKSSF